MSSNTRKSPERKYKGPLLLDASEQIVALKFANQNNFTKGLKVLDLEKGLPYDLVGSKTLIVPKEAIECFEGLDFEVTEVLSAGDLPPEEMAALRAENL